MVDTRKSIKGTQAEKHGEAVEPVEGDTIEVQLLGPLLEAVVRLRRTYPKLSDEDAKSVLLSCGLDVKEAIMTLKSRVVIDLVGEAAMASAKSGGNPLKRKAPDFSKPFNETVTIHVGQAPNQKQPFILYKSVICHVSPYFETALNSDLFVDSKNQEMTIENVSPEVFGLFQKWAMFKTFADDNGQLPSAPQMVNLFALAVKFQTPILQNIVIRGLMGKVFCESPKGFKYLYRTTAPGSALRRLFIDGVVVRHMSQQVFSTLLENHWDEIPKEMLKDMLLAQKKASRPGLKVENYLVPEQVQQV